MDKLDLKIRKYHYEIKSNTLEFIVPPGNFLTVVPVRDLTGQPYNQSLTIYFVSGFLILAGFLPGFWGF